MCSHHDIGDVKYFHMNPRALKCNYMYEICSKDVYFHSHTNAAIGHQLNTARNVCISVASTLASILSRFTLYTTELVFSLVLGNS